VGSCEHGNEPLGSIKGGKFLYRLSDSRLPKKAFDLTEVFETYSIAYVHNFLFVILRRK